GPCLQGFQHERGTAEFSVVEHDPEGSNAVARPFLEVDAQPCPGWADPEVSPRSMPPVSLSETCRMGNPFGNGLFADIIGQTRKTDQASRHLKVRQLFHAYRKERLIVHHIAEAPQLRDVRGSGGLG